METLGNNKTRVNPYMGIYTYSEYDAKYFWGRNVEISTLTETILNANSTILTGYSGCGKSSLINAGIIPRLRNYNFLTIRITPKEVYNYDSRNEFSANFWNLINNRINNVLKEYKVGDNNVQCFQKKTVNGEIDCDNYELLSLWEKLFLCNFKRNGFKVFFLIVLDQFEELFQLDLNIKEINKVLGAYEIMCGAYSPNFSYIRRVFNLGNNNCLFPNDNRIYDNNYSETVMQHRFMISLRKDFLYDLQSYSRYYPVLSQNIFNLDNLDDDQARNVIVSCEDFKPKENFVGLDSHAFIKSILNGKEDFDETDGKPDYRVDTMTLSVVLYQIWENCDQKAQEAVKQSYGDNYTKAFQKIVVEYNKKIEDVFNKSISDFYNDRIKSLKYGSKKRNEEKKAYIRKIICNRPNLNKLNENLDTILHSYIIDSFHVDTELQNYSDEMIGINLDKILYGIKTVDFNILNYIKESVVRKNISFVWKTDSNVLSSAFPNPERNKQLQDKLNILFDDTKQDNHLNTANEINDMVYGYLDDNELDDRGSNIRSVRRALINNLKSVSLFDSIKRCSNSVVEGKLKLYLNKIVFELQEKFLSDSRLFRQSVYIDDICKLFDNAIYGKIDFDRIMEWLCGLIQNGIIDESNGLFEICNTSQNDILQHLQEKNVVIEILKDSNLILRKDNVQYSGTFDKKENALLENDVIDKDDFCSLIVKLWNNDTKVFFEKVEKNEIKLLKLSFDNKCFIFPMSIHFNTVVCILIKLNKLKVNLIGDSRIESDEEKDAFRKELNKYVYRIKGESVIVRTEIADVIKNCKLFTVLNKDNKDNMLEFRHDRLCSMAKEYLEIHKRRQKNLRRYSADVYFSPQGRLKENNCFVECFMGPWYTYSTVMSSIYFMEGDKSSMIDFDTESITQLKKINYNKASSAIVTVALHEKFRGKENEEYYYDLPTNFTHFRVKIEDNKIYNISFETREKNDTVVKKVVVSTGYHKVRFYYDQYDRIVLKEFCVRKEEHKKFYKNDDTNINLLSEDVRVVLPEVGYNAIYYKYKEVYYKCPSETYFLKIDLSKDLREMARNKELTDFYNELDEECKLVKNLKTEDLISFNPKYIVKHIVDCNYGYESRYDDYGRETSRRYFGGTIYGFDVIKLKYDKNDNVNSIAFYTKSSKKTTYKYPSQTDSCIHRIEFLPVDSNKGVCKKTIYYGKDDELCFDKENNINGKEYTYEGEQYIAQNGEKHYILHKLTAKYIKDGCVKFEGNEQEGECVQEVIVRRDIDESSVEIASFGDLEKTKKINGRKIFLDSNIFDYNTHVNCEKIEYHKIKFVYTNGMVKTHIFTKDDEENYKYFIKRSGEVCERERLEYSSEKPRVIQICDDSVGVNDNISMMFVNGGEFKMGHDYDRDYPYREAMPINNVRVDSFYIGQTTVTAGLWNSLMPAEKQCEGESNYPAVNVQWDDVCVFIEKLNKIKSIKDEKLKFRLPTEAEWEYAARGGVKAEENPGCKYSGCNQSNNYDIGDVAVYKHNIGKLSCAGDRAPNELGIYDMSGNVKEWCSDYFWLYPKAFGKTLDNPAGPSIGYARVVRGGGFKSAEYTCRVYNRDCSFPDVKKDDIGFRLVLEVEN